jgi:hypothetical protein
MSLVLFIALSTGGCAAGLSAQVASGCRAADQVRSPARLAFLKDLVSSADSDYVSTRQDLGLAKMNASKLTLVIRLQDCQSAVTALNTLRQEPGMVRRVWLSALGTSGYVLDDTGWIRPSPTGSLTFSIGASGTRALFQDSRSPIAHLVWA